MMLVWWTCLLFFIHAHVVVAQVVINEIADKGSGTACSGEDWIELYNRGDTEVSLAGFILHDDKGPEDFDAFVFNNDANVSAAISSILPKTFLVLCCNGDGISSPAFKIGGDDSITLRDGSPGVEVDSSGVLSDVGEFDRTYARSNVKSTGREFVQTMTPTPGSENVITVPPTKDYQAQNTEGSAFFGMDDRGDRVSDSFDVVVDLHAQVDASEWTYLRSNPYEETYVPVNEFKVVSSKGTFVLPSPGRMRPRGQSSLFIAICMNEEAIPFKLDFQSVNATQTLFGMETAYLRTHLGDESHMQEFIMHRMLARFGLPHLRTRHVRFHVNGEQLGFYTFMEAPDQEYVMSRNFDYTFNKDQSALYKVKSLSVGCGNKQEFRKELYVTSTGPYSFERGNHRNEVIIKRDWGNCIEDFFRRISSERRSVAQSFFDAGFESVNDCGEFLLDKKLIDRDIGSKDFDTPMEKFIDSHLSDGGKCLDKQCSSKKQISDDIDIDNWLKNFAVYAVVAAQDSPMGNGNNYFLAAAGDSTIGSPKWKMVPYDHNSDATDAGAMLCDPVCGLKDLTDWSVIRPTCRGLSTNPLVGPILIDPQLHARYLSFVKEFVQNVYTNETLWNELKEHSEAIRSVASNSPDSATYGTGDTSRLFKWMKTRSIKVLEQLDLWDNGNFPKHASIESIDACATTTDKLYFSDKCTSPDGLGGYDCCANIDWGEPQTCAIGYKVKRLDEVCG